MIISRINKKVPQRMRTNTLCAKVLSFVYLWMSLLDKSFYKEMKDSINKYRATGAKFSTLKLWVDILEAYTRNQITSYEYRCFNFAEKSQKARETYISTIDLLSYFKGNDVNFLPNDKYQFTSMVPFDRLRVN